MPRRTTEKSPIHTAKKQTNKPQPHDAAWHLCTSCADISALCVQPVVESNHAHTSLRSFTLFAPGYGAASKPAGIAAGGCHQRQQQQEERVRAGGLLDSVSGEHSLLAPTHSTAACITPRRLRAMHCDQQCRNARSDTMSNDGCPMSCSRQTQKVLGHQEAHHQVLTTATPAISPAPPLVHTPDQHTVEHAVCDLTLTAAQ